MGFFPSVAPNYRHKHVTGKYPFMTCIVRVNTQYHWQRTVARVLDKCFDVHSFRMDDNGVVEISGTVDPSLLLKMLGRAGRSAELCWFQFGECSSNLFLPTNPGGRYLHAPNLSRPKLPSQQALTPSINSQNYISDHDNHYYHKRDYDHGDGYHHRHYNKHDYDHGHSYHRQQGYEYQSGYSHSGNQTQSHGGEDIGCCRVM